jgi:hypothetical protein
VEVGVWCAVSARRIVGPMFLMKQLIAKDMCRSFFPEEEKLYDWFQQDSATAHAAHMSLQALSNVFGDRIISSFIWLARSPDINPCDFFFCWGCWKDKAYSGNPHMEELKKIFVGKLQVFLQNSFKGSIRTSSAGTRNVCV